MSTAIYNIAKFLAVFLTVSIAMTVAATVLPSYRPQIEYIGVAALVVAQIWAFTRGRKWRFSVRTLLIVTAIESTILGAYVALKK